jgi:hypothetical protein
MDAVSKFILPVILFLLTLGFGFWLSRSGRPYNGLLFNIHKLVALASVVAISVRIYHTLGSSGIQALPAAFIILLGLCVLALFVTGALLSAGKPVYTTLRTVHDTAMVFATIAILGTIFLI